MTRRGWTLVGLLVAMLLGAPLYGQVTLTTVQDTVYSANGTPAAGTVVVSWSAFTTAAGNSIAAGSTSATLGANGALSMALAPNAGATPMGSYYTAVFHLSDGTTSRQYWVVPAGGGSVTLAAIENQALPTSVAMQTVSKAYVDTQIAKAQLGLGAGSGSVPYVQTAGDAMTGALVLAADPTSAQQAADKHYVDASVAAVSVGLATKVSALPTTAQSVAQPVGTQLEVNSLNGVLDATGFLSGNGNNGIGNALGSTACTSGCVMSVSQTYPGTDSVPVGGLSSGTHAVDSRGGADFEVFQNPLPVTGTSNVASTLNQVTTVTAPQSYAARPSAGMSASVLTLQQLALTGGSNQLPGSVEAVPYGKSNYAVLEMVGRYYTQGQHVQAGNEIDCYAVGDCLAGGQFITSSGGYRDQADEGAHPFDLQVNEDTRVFQGTCGSGCTPGSTNVVVNITANPGTQGDGRFLIDKNPAKVVSTGIIAGASGDLLPIVNFNGTSFPVSTMMQTAAAATSQAKNLQPGTVTLPIATSGVHGGFATSTAGLPSTGVACIADTGTSFPSFETAKYTVADATHLQLTLNKVHASGAMLAVGGMCGYGLEQTVDTMGQVRQVFPVVASLNATQLYYAGAQTAVAGLQSEVSTSGYLNVSLPIASAVRSGNTVTLTTSGNFTSDLNGLRLTVSGVADASFNGTFGVTTTGPNTLTYSENGPDGSSSGGAVGLVTGGYALYPMAEVLNVYDPASGSVDGTMTLAPNTVAWAAGDAVEEPHYHQQLTYADTEYVTQFVPRPIQYTSAGKQYNGQMGPGAKGWWVMNGVSPGNYLGAGGTHQPPDSAYVASGVWGNSFEADAGEGSVLRIHCNLHGCNRWNSTYALFAMDRSGGVEDFLLYSPQNSAATWLLGGTAYTFSPSAFTAPSIQATAMTSSTLQSTSTAAHSVLLGGATTGAVQDSVAVIAGSGHGLELLGTSGTPHSTFIMSATLNGTPTALFEIGSGFANAGKNFYVYDGTQNYTPLFASDAGKFVGVNTTTPQHTLEVNGDVAAQSVVLSDTANGHTYRLTITNGVLTTTLVQ